MPFGIASVTICLVLSGSAAAQSSALAAAVKRQDHSAVRTLLAAKADVNAPLGDGATALHWAVFWDDLAMVERLLDAGATPDVANDLRISPLFLACGGAGNPVIVERLLTAGADPNRASETGVTPLMEAARTGNVAAARALLTQGANVNATEVTKGQTALMWAVSQRHPGAVRLLVERGADVHARTRVGLARVLMGPGFQPVAQPGGRRSVRTSKEIGVPVATGGNTALLFAAQVGDVESAEILLTAGANVNDAAADRNSVLVTAAHAGHVAVLRLLLERGADPNATGAGYAALHAAALRGDRAMVEALIARGADVNRRITSGTPVRRIGPQLAFTGALVGATPLLVAAVNLEVEVMQTLVAAGADVSTATKGGITPLLAIVGIGDRQLRLTRPKDFREEDEFSDLKRSDGRVMAGIRTLIDRGADITAADPAGDTAMHGCAAAGFSGAIQLLAERGADVNARNKRGQTPLAIVVAAQQQSRRPTVGQDGRAIPAAVFAQAEAALRKIGATP